MKIYFTLLLLWISTLAIAADCYWQQRVSYVMDIDFETATHRFTGKQTLTYTNNSPDTLKKVFYHLYFNAFQPGSMMDVRSQNISDPDDRVGDRIGKLTPDEIGYQHIDGLKQDGKKVKYEVVGTILTVWLAQPMLPGSTTVFDMEFNSQVPLQVRRSGRNNKEGIAYSMTQWYPKMVEYDRDGWHANPYIGREFHGVWGDFDVRIHMDSSFTIGGTGYLQNPQEIGKGYEQAGQALSIPNSPKRNWHFVAKNVHDFAWAADKNYRHTTAKVPNGPMLHFLFLDDSTMGKNWEKLPPYAVRCFEVMNTLIGPYPYEQYSVIQGGDGGMEYPMATLISGKINLSGLISVTVHESIHSWFQGLLATNESLYAWMDEGFTSYAQNIVLDSLYHRKRDNPHQGNYNSYYRLVASGLQEPLSTHADHFTTNRAYGTAAYSMGNVFLHQLGYVIGQQQLEQTLKAYFSEWKYKHPTPQDFKRIAEKQSDMELDWYFEYWINTTKTIDYGIKQVEAKKNTTLLTLERIGQMPMPIDLAIRLSNGKTVHHHVPLRIMRGWKGNEYPETKLEADWPWTYEVYELELNYSFSTIETIEIDPSLRMADVDRTNNVFPSGKRHLIRRKKKKK